MNQPVRPCLLHQPGRLAYAAAWEWQSMLCHQRRLDEQIPDALILLEHWPVYTLGQGADLRFVKFDIHESAIEVHRVERGGEVTYHCPGQLVGYPILNLRFHRQDLHWYLRQLEEVVIQTLGFYGLEGERIPGLTGVWVDGYKVAAIGVKVSRWITMHGFAINVCPDLSGFRLIVPCGIADKPVGSLQQFLPDISVERVQRDLISVFAKVFNVTYIFESEARSFG